MALRLVHHLARRSAVRSIWRTNCDEHDLATPRGETMPGRTRALIATLPERPRSPTSLSFFTANWNVVAVLAALEVAGPAARTSTTAGASKQERWTGQALAETTPDATILSSTGQRAFCFLKESTPNTVRNSVRREVQRSWRLDLTKDWSIGLGSQVIDTPLPAPTLCGSAPAR